MRPGQGFWAHSLPGRACAGQVGSSRAHGPAARVVPGSSLSHGPRERRPKSPCVSVLVPHIHCSCVPAPGGSFLPRAPGQCPPGALSSSVWGTWAGQPAILSREGHLPPEEQATPRRGHPWGEAWQGCRQAWAQKAGRCLARADGRQGGLGGHHPGDLLTRRPHIHVPSSVFRMFSDVRPTRPQDITPVII